MNWGISMKTKPEPQPNTLAGTSPEASYYHVKAVPLAKPNAKASL